MENKYKEILQLFDENRYKEVIEKIEALENLPDEDRLFLNGLLGAAYNNEEEYDKAGKILTDLNNEEDWKNPSSLYRLSYTYYYMYEEDKEAIKFLEKAAQLISKSLEIEESNEYRNALAVEVFHKISYHTPEYLDLLFKEIHNSIDDNLHYYIYLAEAYYMLCLNYPKPMYFQNSLANYDEYLKHYPDDKEFVEHRIALLTKSFNEANN